MPDNGPDEESTWHKATDSEPDSPDETVAHSPAPKEEDVPRPASRPVPELPGYEILELLGEGGMGVVYKARHIPLKRIVALKMIRAGEHATAESLGRFVAEAQAVARLQHPHIVQIHEIGEHNNLPYFSLEFAEGGNLSRRLAGTPLPAEEATQVMLALAHAMQAAHDNGIVHRDLKPANILLSLAGGQASIRSESNPVALDRQATTVDFSTPTQDGLSLSSVIPKIADFGLAKLEDSESGVTTEGDILGTPSYMAPEQAQAKQELIGPATDVYGLGAILYEMLTGRPPFQSGTKLETLHLVVEGDPVRPRWLNPNIPKDLETICLHCLHKDPSRRYTSPAMLAADLTRFLEHEPIEARPIGPAERFWRWCRRYPVVSMLTLSLFAALLIGAVTSAYFAVQANARAAAEAEARREAQWLQYRSHVDLAQWEMLQGNYHFAEKLLATCPEQFHNWEYHYLRRLYKSIRPGILKHRSQVWKISVSPDGKHLATATADGTLSIWDWQQRKVVQQKKSAHQGVIWEVHFAPDGKRLATAGQDKTVRLWDAKTLQPQHTLKNDINPLAEAWAVRFSRDGKYLAAGWGQNNVNAGQVILWALPQPKQPLAVLPHRFGVWVVAFSPDSQHLASASGAFESQRILNEPGEIQIWQMARVHVDKEAAKPDFKLTDHRDTCSAVAFSPDGKLLASTGYDNRVLVYDFVPTAKQLKRRFDLKGHMARRVGSLAFTPNSRHLVSGSWDRTAKLWDMQTGQLERNFPGHFGFVGGLGFSRNGHYLFTGCEDDDHSGSVRIWDWDLSRLIYTSLKISAGGALHTMAFSADATKPVVAAAGVDGVITLWDLSNHDKKPFTSNRKHIAVNSVAFSPDRQYLASGHDDGEVSLWKVRQDGLHHVATLEQQKQPVLCVSFSPNGEYLAAGYGNQHDFKSPGHITVWDVASRRVHQRELRHSNSVFGVRFSPEGDFLVGVSGDYMEADREFQSEIKLWNVTSGAATTLPAKHRDKVLSAAFSPDGKWLATAGADQTIILWDASRQTPVRVLPGHTGDVNGLAFSPDSTRLASASSDHTVRLWAVDRGVEVLELEVPSGECYAVEFSRDGTYLAAANADGSIKVWRTK